MVQAAHAGVVILDVRFGERLDGIGTCGYWTGKRKLRAGICLPGVGIKGWATASYVTTRNHPNHGSYCGVDRARSSERPLSQKVGNIGLSNHLRTSQDEVANCCSLIPKKEKCLAVDNRPAKRTAVLVPLHMDGCFRCGEIVLGVKHRIPHEFKSVAVEVVGA